MKKIINVFLVLFIILGTITSNVTSYAEDDKQANLDGTSYAKEYTVQNGVVLIDDIYYDFDYETNHAFAVYSKRKGTILKYPDFVTYKNKKFKVTMVYASNESSGDVAIYNKYNYKEVYLPKYAHTVYFDGVKLNKLRKVYISENIEEIIGLDNLSKVKINIDKNNKHLKMQNGAIYSKNGKQLKALIKGKKIYKISKGTKELKISNNNKIKKIIFPNDIKVLENYGVTGCKNLKQIELGKNTKKIGMFFFMSLKSLKNITIPKNVNKIDDMAFSGCKNLNKIILKSSKNAPKLSLSTFKNTADGISFFVKNQKVADELLNQLKKNKTEVKNANIYVGKTLVYSNIN